MRSRYFIILFIAIIFNLSASARDINNDVMEPVLGQELYTAFAGVTLYGIYKRPRERSGTHQFTEIFNTDGTTEYTEGALKDSGKWVTSNDTICFTYIGEFMGPKSCFKVFRLGTCLYSYDPRVISGGKPIVNNAWSVKAKTDQSIANCEDLVS